MDNTLKNKTISKIKENLSSLSPRMKVVAKYILDNQADFGLDVIRVTSRKSGVSTYTLFRMAERLGFDSYDSFREPFRDSLVASVGVLDRPEWLDELATKGEIGQIQADATLNALAVVRRTMERLSPETLEQVADLMIGTRRVYVMAVRASYSIAYYLNYAGRMVLDTLQIIPSHVSSTIDDLNRSQPGDVLIGITTAPYSQETLEACRFAQNRGVKIILITDSEIVAPDLKPEYTLIASAMSTHYFASYSGVTAVIDALLAVLMHKTGSQGQARIDSYEELRQEHDRFWSGKKTLVIR